MRSLTPPFLLGKYIEQMSAFRPTPGVTDPLRTLAEMLAQLCVEGTAPRSMRLLILRRPSIFLSEAVLKTDQSPLVNSSLSTN